MAEHVTHDVNALHAALRDFPCIVLPGSAPDSYKSYLLRAACERQHRAVFRLYAAAYNKKELLGTEENTSWSSGILTSLLHSISLTAVPLCVVLNVSLAEAAELLAGVLVVSGDSLWWVAASGQLMALRTVRFVIDTDEDGQLPDHGVLTHFYVHRSASLRAPVPPPIVPLHDLPELLASSSATCVAHGPPWKEFPGLRPDSRTEITQCNTVDEAIQQIRRAWIALEAAQRRAAQGTSSHSPKHHSPTFHPSAGCTLSGGNGTEATSEDVPPPPPTSPLPNRNDRGGGEMEAPLEAQGRAEPGRIPTEPWGSPKPVQPPVPIPRPAVPFLLRPRLFVFLDIDACNPVALPLLPQRPHLHDGVHPCRLLRVLLPLPAGG
eukprot:GGOE01005679.1.p1 GENE.GGOE01005679.1~~GGOE01005679.1.p1  ORF type:complete len:387 (-),score=83.84 GGOE01005679.1:670-1803(-)